MAGENEGFSLDDILSGASVPAEIAPTLEPEAPTEPSDGLSRDEHGRFAAKPEAEDADARAAIEGHQPERQETVPQQALHAERQKAREAEDRHAREMADMRAQIAALQPKPAPVEPAKPVELWDDPDKFVVERLTPMQQELQQIRSELSLTRAVSTHGQDTVSAAENALKAAVESGQINPENLKAQLSKSKDPFGDVVNWYNNRPEAAEQRMRDKIIAELRASGELPAPADPAADPDDQPSPRTPLRIPARVSSIPGSAATEAGPDDSLDALTSQKRKRA